MAARAKRLHLFIVSARGRRQNVCLRVCVCVYKTEKEGEKERKRER